jgi:hypothetical protein
MESGIYYIEGGIECERQISNVNASSGPGCLHATRFLLALFVDFANNTWMDFLVALRSAHAISCYSILYINSFGPHSIIEKFY